MCGPIGIGKDKLPACHSESRYAMGGCIVICEDECCAVKKQCLFNKRDIVVTGMERGR